MSLLSLAWGNIKANFRKYVIYFLSLSFSVFTLYSFLALMDNDYVMMAFNYDARYRSLLLGFAVVIMVFVLFFLVSSNNSFLRARKKEISTYSLFGMTNKRIGQLIFLETMLVGIVALIIGIAVGVFFSKLVAMILLDISLASFAGRIGFTISASAIYRTTTVFLLVFGAMGLSGWRVINRFELVDLFKAHKVIEPPVQGSTRMLLASLVLIGAGYYLATLNNPLLVMISTVPVLILVTLGTYLFFWGGLPKILKIVKGNKRLYYQGTNLVSTAAFTHRMKSIGSVMATIAILSAVATTAIATGFTLYQNTAINAYSSVGFDLYFYGGEHGKVVDDVNQVFSDHGIEIMDQFTARLYQTSPYMASVVIGNSEYITQGEQEFRVYSESLYNHFVSLARSELQPVQVNAGEALYVYPYAPDSDGEMKAAVSGRIVTFSHQEIEIAYTRRSNIAHFGRMHSLVLNDQDFQTLLTDGDIVSSIVGDSYNQVTVINYPNALRNGEVIADIQQVLNGRVETSRSAYLLYIESLETFGLICFIGFFMSVVFILMTASLLYFKQIVAAEEEKAQYKMLQKMGMNKNLQKKVIAKRLLPVFLIPLVVAIIHSMFAMKAADTMVFSNMISANNSYLVVLSFSAVMYGVYAIVYGLFYLITNEQYSRIVR